MLPEAPANPPPAQKAPRYASLEGNLLTECGAPHDLHSVAKQYPNLG